MAPIPVDSSPSSAALHPSSVHGHLVDNTCYFTRVCNSQVLADVPSFDYISMAKQRGNAFGAQNFRDYNIKQQDARACVIDNYKANHEQQVRCIVKSSLCSKQPFSLRHTTLYAACWKSTARHLIR